MVGNSEPESGCMAQFVQLAKGTSKVAAMCLLEQVKRPVDPEGYASRSDPNHLVL